MTGLCGYGLSRANSPITSWTKLTRASLQRKRGYVLALPNSQEAPPVIYNASCCSKALRPLKSSR